MTADTKPFFIVSSGQAGEAEIASTLSTCAGLEMHREYLEHIHQPLAVHRYMRLVDDETCVSTLLETCGRAIHYCDQPFWGDASTQLSWLIKPLAEAIPNARFVHLVRDGRKVANAYIRKFASEFYEDRAIAILRNHYENPETHPAPPPEKKFWWPLPYPEHPAASRFRMFSQFERIAWHWGEINRVIIRQLTKLDQSRYIRVHFEDLCSSPIEMRRMVEFLDLPYADGLAELVKPRETTREKDLLSSEQSKMFRGAAWEMMELLGYASADEYA